MPLSLDHVSYGFVIEPKSKTTPLFNQVHESDIIEYPITTADAIRADGAITSKVGVELFVFSADCLPILFYSDETSAPIAAVHCGWRGARAGIARKAVERFHDVTRLHVTFGPCLLSCCFEVKSDFLEQFPTCKKYVRNREDRLFFSLPEFVRETDLKSIPDDRIQFENLKCTFCSSPELPSYRRNGGTDPRIRSWIKKHDNSRSTPPK